MLSPYYNLPSGSVSDNARLFANRYQALDLIPDEIKYLEIGVLGGDYSEIVISKKRPKLATLVDTYLTNDWPQRGRFDSQTHLQFVSNRFGHIPSVEVRQGSSTEVLRTLDTKYDYIYIDAQHDNISVHNDLVEAYSLLDNNGIIGLNDYVIKDPFRDHTYGVVSATNEFLENYPEFKIIGFSFNEAMFSDIYIQKTSGR